MYGRQQPSSEVGRATALEEMLETPQNIHRWRKLQGTDPESFDLLQKIQILQK